MYKFLLGFTIVIISLNSCKRTDDSALPQGYKFETELNLKMKISSDGGEMFASGTTPFNIGNNDLVGMKITKKSTKGDNIIASGIFLGKDIKDGLSVELEHKENYYILATIIKDGFGVTKTGDLYGAPFNNIATSTEENWTLHTDADYLGNIYGQTNPKSNSLARGDRFVGRLDFTADYSNPDIVIPLKRKAIKLMYNVTELIPGHKVKLQAIRNKSTKSKTTEYRLIRWDSTDDLKDISISEDIYTYPGDLSKDNPATIHIVATVWDGDKIIKTLEDDISIENLHQYMININANPSFNGGLSLSLEGEWKDDIENIDLKNIPLD